MTFATSPSSAATGRQRGVTMISVMLMTVSLLTLGLLAVRSSVREVTQAGQLVARERAMMVAQAAVDRAAAHIMSQGLLVDNMLQGFNPGQGNSCAGTCTDCIPGTNGIQTGRRNEVLAGEIIGCAGRPCMRQGAVLQDAVGQNWCEVPFQSIVAGGDAEARVSVWIRNNSADALGPGGSGQWVADNDGRVVLTAMATVRATTVTVEQEVLFSAFQAARALLPQSADQGYGGGHNNDNTSVSVCTDEYVAVQ